MRGRLDAKLQLSLLAIKGAPTGCNWAALAPASMSFNELARRRCLPT